MISTRFYRGKEMKEKLAYSSGHPWYYVLGGKVPSIKKIWEEAKASGYKGYLREDIANASGNNSKLRQIRQEAVQSLKRDISRYRECAFELNQIRKISNPANPKCLDVHTAISLKRNHIYNDVAHIRYIDELLSQQPELFELF